MSHLIALRRAALNLLARREHSTHELTHKLSLKGFKAEDIATILLQLQTENLLSHTRFIENYTHYRRNKGYGPLRIQAELLSKGLEKELIEHHLKMTDNAWLTDAYETWRKRFKILPPDYKSRVKQMRFLQQRGFTLEQINYIFHSDDELCAGNPTN